MNSHSYVAWRDLAPAFGIAETAEQSRGEAFSVRQCSAVFGSFGYAEQSRREASQLRGVVARAQGLSAVFGGFGNAESRHPSAYPYSI